MWPNDALALGVNAGYYALVLWLADEARHLLKMRREWTSRAIQIFLAVFIVPSLTFFAVRWWAVVVPCLLAGVVFLSSLRGGGFKRAARARRTVFMLAAYATLTLIFWNPEWRFVAAVGVLSAAFGLVALDVGDDAWARDRFVVAGEYHSLEAVLFGGVVMAVALFLALIWLAPLGFWLSAGLAVLLALVGSLVTLVSIRETAEFTVPVVTSLLLLVLVRGGVPASALGQFLAGVGLSAVIAVGGLAVRALSTSGAAGAVLIGTFTFGLGGWHWGIPLVVFFAGSSWLSRLRRPAQGDRTRELTGKTGRRELSQTLANGGAGAALAVAKVLGLGSPPALFAAYLGAISAANADTWATEVGTRFRAEARLLVGWRLVPAGTSGAITGPGTFATLLGALVVGVTGGLISPLVPEFAAAGGGGVLLAVRLALAGLVGGVLGSLLDSLLGATLQGVFRCPECGRVSERRWHAGCSRPGELIRGLAALDNDAVNFLATLGGALMGLLVYWIA